MKQYYYADVMPDGRIRGCFTYDGPDEGPLEPHWETQAEGSPVLLAGPINWAGPTPTCVLYWKDGTQVWVETQSLDDAIDGAVAAIDTAADVARMDVIARQTNTTEYQRAEAQARAFKSAGYLDADVPSCVASWAKAKRRDGWTARQAADDIIATADRWYAVLDAIRELRLCAKEDVRHAAGNGDVAGRVAQFSDDLADLMKGSA